MKNHFRADHVQMVTEPGPCLILAHNNPDGLLDSIPERTDIPLNNHRSNALALVGLLDCGGNPVGTEKQVEQLKNALSFLHQKYPRLKLVSLWVDEDWEVQEISAARPD